MIKDPLKHRIASLKYYHKNEDAERQRHKEYYWTHHEEELKRHHEWYHNKGGKGLYTSTKFCMAVCSNFEAVLYLGEHCDNVIRCADDGSIIRRYCFDKETYCNMPKIDPRDEEYCKSDEFDSCPEHLAGSRCTKGDTD